MIISKTPFRMSFFGGGTDMPDFYKKHNGAVLSTTFDKYCYVNIRHLPRFFEYSTEIVYSQIERVTALSDIHHPLIRNAMQFMKMHEIHLTYEADLPARTGLGTSSSFAVGLLNAFYAMKGKYVDKKRLADEAIYLERVLCAEAGGLQDQIAASFGGLNRINFTADGYEVKPIIISKERSAQLNENLMLFYTGISRFSSDIQAKTGKEIQKAEKQSQLLHMVSMVDDAERILTDKLASLNDFGRMLDETWRLKRGISSSVSTESIDILYERALKAGALGGKLLGAGGGGFFVFYVEKDKQAYVRENLSELLYVPFFFETGGSQVIYYAPEDYELNDEVRD